MTHIGSYIHELRTDAHMNQEELAHKLDLNFADYVNIEWGKKEPDFETVVKICSLYGVSMDDMVSHVD